MSKKLDPAAKASLPEERAEYYRQCAEDALRRANETTSPDQRNGFLKMAAGWHQMATEREKTRKNRPAPEAAASKPRPRRKDQR